MTTVRIFFEKCGESAYISLLDLQRVFHRMLKMSSLPVYYTQGFNPHIYLSFTCPLSLGQESLCESCEVKTEQETIDPQAWIDALQPLMPRGIVITKVAPAVEKVGEIETAAYEITMPAGSAIALDAYNNAEHAEVTKKTKRGCKTLELKHYLDRIEYTIEGGTLRFTALPKKKKPWQKFWKISGNWSSFSGRTAQSSNIWLIRFGTWILNARLCPKLPANLSWIKKRLTVWISWPQTAASANCCRYWKNFSISGIVKTATSKSVCRVLKP